MATTLDFIKRKGSEVPFRKGEGEVLPREGRRNVLITSALPYVNNVPHLGNIIGCILSADVYARYCRLRGDNVLFIGGTDEYGTATENKAVEEGVSPQEVCDKYHAIHSSVYSWFQASFDHFGRTSAPEQTRIAQDIFLKLHSNGHLKEETRGQLFCESCDKFLADRFVEGRCPHCQEPEARGDQCDRCAKLLDPVELLNPRCKLCGGSPVLRDTVHLFLDLPKLVEPLSRFVEKSSREGRWTSSSLSITEAWLKNLQPRCITRDLKWGIPVPLPDPKFKSKVLYVWFDAPIGYLSITADYTSQWERWWKRTPEQKEKVELVQFFAKDNVPFHTILFPASLIGSGEEFTLLHSIGATEFLNYEGGKFSKARRTGVFGDQARSCGLSPTAWRYYLLRIRPENSDASFNWDDFAAKNNELLQKFGNLCYRALKFLKQRFDGLIQVLELTQADQELIQNIDGCIREYHASFSKLGLKKALEIVLEFAEHGNRYFTSQRPWEAFPAENEAGEPKRVLTPEEEQESNAKKARAATVVSLSCNLVKLIAIYLEPFVPSITEEVLSQLNTTHEPLEDRWNLAILPEGHRLVEEPTPIFKKIESEQVRRWREQFGGVRRV